MSEFFFLFFFSNFDRTLNNFDKTIKSPKDKRGEGFKVCLFYLGLSNSKMIKLMANVQLVLNFCNGF